MTWSEIINLILGGGLVACLIGILTMKATVKEANAKAEKAGAEAETVRIDNAERATRILVENIVKPLKDELNATREDLQGNKRETVLLKKEMARLRKALDTANGCPHRDGCPVLRKLRDDQKSGESGNDDRDVGGDGGHDLPKGEPEGNHGTRATKSGHSDGAGGQPP
jgi:hypothetical protein